MIITRTPLRISFAGGGTDFPGYYSERGPGMVVSAAISPSVYVLLKARYDRDVYVGYSRTEIASCSRKIEHDLVRECLLATKVAHGVEIKILADVPGEGSGLGSSSALVVGLLNALHTYRGHPVGPEQLASEACQIEIDRLEKPIGIQDQYIAAYGGLRWFEFYVGRSVKTSESLADHWVNRREFAEQLRLFRLGGGRKSETILAEQQQNIPERAEVLDGMVGQANAFWRHLTEEGDLTLGPWLNEGWDAKKQLASGISNPEIEGWRERARDAGATGSKLCGAGGSGHLLVACPPEKGCRVSQALGELPELPFEIEPRGSRVIFQSE